MSEITGKIEGEGKKQRLILSIPIKKTLSKSGKNMLIASSGGNQELELVVDGKRVKVGVNAYIPAE